MTVRNVLGARFCRFKCSTHCIRPRLDVALHRLASSQSQRARHHLTSTFFNTSTCVHDSPSEEYSFCDLSGRLMALALSHKTPLLPDHSSPSSLRRAEGRRYDSSQPKEGNGSRTRSGKQGSTLPYFGQELAYYWSWLLVFNKNCWIANFLLPPNGHG